MTRLIDADALNEKLCETTIFIKGGEMFQRMINDAPTIELTGDLISRQDAILAITGEPPEAHYPSWYADRIKSLPSAETPTVLEKHQLSAETPTDTSADLISRQDAINAIENTDVKITAGEWDGLTNAIKLLPSAEVEDRLYIKIYADDEPSVMAEKLYQICGETQNEEVAEWLKEYFPSAPDSRQRGEWVGCTGCEHYDQQQTRLICHECKRYYSDKYKGGDDE